ncbi:hypothetical protein ASG59_12410 [Methylobacterium sp. Leaf466]|nr:hypothetical protein ASG59_12410 [Methylobacterium sp. Leaf466]
MNREARWAEIEACRSDRAIDPILDRSGPVWWHSDRLHEEDMTRTGVPWPSTGPRSGGARHVRFAA